MTNFSGTSNFIDAIPPDEKRMEELLIDDPYEYMSEYVRYFAAEILKDIVAGNPSHTNIKDIRLSWTQMDRPAKATMSSDGLGVIILNPGYVYDVYNYFCRILESGAIFGSRALRQNDEETIKKAVASMNLDSTPYNVAVPTFLTQIAVCWVVAHESAHIIHGHLGLMNSIKSKPLASTVPGVNIGPDYLTNLDKRTLEFDADSFAAKYSFSRIDGLVKIRPGLLPILRKMHINGHPGIFDKEVMLHWATFAAVASTFPFAKVSEITRQNHNQFTHPSFESRIQTLKAWVTSYGNDYGFTEAYQWAVVFAGIEAKCADQVLNPETRPPSDQCMTLYGRIADQMELAALSSETLINWPILRPALSEFAWLPERLSQTQFNYEKAAKARIFAADAEKASSSSSA